MAEITLAKLERKFPGEGLKRFTEIADLGGWGSVGVGTNELSEDAILDVGGLYSSDTVTDATKSKIRTLSGDDKTPDVKKDNANGPTK